MKARKKLNFEYSSGGVVFKKEKGKILWLITKSSPSELYPNSIWRLPKGWLDDEKKGPGPLTRGEKRATENDLKNTAIREVKEEAGIKAKIIQKIGTTKIFYTKNGERFIKYITFYLMRWEKDLAEGFGFETSEIGWFTFNEAQKKLKFKNEKEIFRKAKKIIDSIFQESFL